METPNESDDCFYDALDDFPFHDCNVDDRPAHSTSDSSSSVAEVSSPETTLRRRSTSVSSSGAKDSNFDSTTSVRSNITETHDPKTRYRERRHRIYRDLKENEKNLESNESTRSCRGLIDSPGAVSNVEGENNNKEESTVTTGNDGQSGGAVGSVDSVGELGDSSSSNFLVFLAGLVIKAIAFQVNLFVHFITFPISVLYSSYMLVTDPFGATRRCRSFLLQKVFSLWNLVGGMIGSLIKNWLKDHDTMWKLGLRFGWGLLWSFYVCIILSGLLVFSIMISGVLMRGLVEEPMRMREDLTLDYTKNSPVAFVPVMSCYGALCDGNCKEDIDGKYSGSRVIPANHKLQVTVLLTLPESEYNRNLGNFQVRVDFLSANGKTLASKRHPCMLKFKSGAIRVILTFLKIVPLVAGYVSESQTLKLKIKGFTEGRVPTSCLKVTIEQRAEFRPGGGIPEIYDASLVLESELPLLKRIVWHWKKTLFIWISIVSFMMQLLFTLLCCRSLIIPRSRPRARGGSALNTLSPNNPRRNVDIRENTDGTNY